MTLNPDYDEDDEQIKLTKGLWEFEEGGVLRMSDAKMKNCWIYTQDEEIRSVTNGLVLDTSQLPSDQSIPRDNIVIDVAFASLPDYNTL